MIKSFFRLFSYGLIIFLTIIVYQFFSESSSESLDQKIYKFFLEERSFLIKRELYIETIINKNEPGKFWGTGKKALIVCKAKVPFGIDLSNLSKKDFIINNDKKELIITLPEPDIYDVIIIDLYIYDVKTGIFVSSDNYLQSLYKQVFAEAKSEMKSIARKQYLDEVKIQIKSEMNHLINNLLLGIDDSYDITINYSSQKVIIINKDTIRN
jgi:hypothetical protein